MSSTSTPPNEIELDSSSPSTSNPSSSMTTSTTTSASTVPSLSDDMGVLSLDAKSATEDTQTGIPILPVQSGTSNLAPPKLQPPSVAVRDMINSPVSTTSSSPQAGSLASSTLSARPIPLNAGPQRPGPGVMGKAPMGGGRKPMGMAGRMGPNQAGGMGMGQSRLPPSLQAKMDAMSRRAAAGSSGAGAQGSQTSTPPSAGGPDPTSMSALLASAAAANQHTDASASRGSASSPIVPSIHSRGPPSAPRPSAGGPAMGMGGLAARRAAAAAAAGGAGGASGGTGSISRPTMGPLGGSAGPSGLPGMGRLRRPGVPGMTLSQMGMGQGTLGGAKDGQPGAASGGAGGDSAFSNFSRIVDPSGRLNFSSRAVIHSEGVDFSNGHSFKIKMDEMELREELGRGNYGTVQKVYHRPTKVMMAMKEIRLELDDAKLNAIIMELDILHRAVAPEIVEFYGAFTIESCVYYCMEFMDAGSLDSLHGDGVPEDVLARITKSMVKGLGFLKDELEVMHRDVKPTNVLVNKKGEVKLCDFGVSGQLEKSLAKTNIGCQSYMAPERIKGESQNNLGTYTVSSDVWSVGLSIIELAKGCYPYPPETYSNMFAQLQAIVYGAPPTLPDGYSDIAQDFVASCLRKIPETRPTYAQLLKHPWMLEDAAREVDMVGWVARALEAKATRQRNGQTVSSSAPELQPGPQGVLSAVDGAAAAGPGSIKTETLEKSLPSNGMMDGDVKPSEGTVAAASA